MKVRNLAWLASLCLGACTTTDYSSGITTFSNAVSSANAAEQSLATADQQARFNQWSQQVAKSPTLDTDVDLTKCGAATGYKAGDCTVTNSAAGPAPTSAEKSSFAGITKYAALLSAIASDQTCTTLQSDAKSLATATSDIAKVAKATAPAADASPIATIVSTIGCIAVDRDKLSILKTATQNADGSIQSMSQVIARKDGYMEATVIEDRVRILDRAQLAYRTSGTPADLQAMVAAAAAADTAHALNVDTLVKEIAAAHQKLTSDLQSPTVDWSRIEADAQTLLTDAQTVETAAASLAPSKPASATAASK